MDVHDRKRRMHSFGRAVRSADEDYWDEVREWDALARRDSGEAQLACNFDTRLEP